MSDMLDIVWLIPAFPLAGFVLLVALGRKLGEPLAGWLGTAMMGGSFVATLLVFLGLVDLPSEERIVVEHLFDWVPAGKFNVAVGFLADPLALTMCLFITGVGTLIHLYSIGYMHGDENFHKFFVYLNLFAFSMLMLVLGDNLLLTFLGWEGVGACSYLLISFWFGSDANASAGKKAFVTNRIGDFGFMIAIFLTFTTLGSIQYVDLFEKAELIAPVTATAIAVLFFVGACGKSAQFPLYLWLPDAMAGPTPVSALIHAATMVTSGVYLMTRINPVLAQANGWVPDLIAWVGVGTALFAATIALGQNDIKKVLAYSTVSQLGYMFLAVGTGAYVAAIFHMITHAFFKALLFLGSGSVIHGMHDDQDMRHYGKLLKWMPITGATFIVGWLAIAGVPPFSGFWSKDEILAHAWDVNPALWVFGIITAVLTAFYMSRQVFMTFIGRYRYADATSEEINAAWDAKIAGALARADAADAELAKVDPADARGRLAKVAAANEAHREAARLNDRLRAARVPAAALFGEPDTAEVDDLLPRAVIDERKQFHPHEASWLMWLPLVALAGLAIVGGLLNLPFSDSLKRLEHWLEPSLHENEAHLAIGNGALWTLAVIAIAGSVVGIAAAFMVYVRGKVAPSKVELPVFARGWGYDEAVTKLMGGPGTASFDAAAQFDRRFVDGLVNGTAKFLASTGGRLRRLQSGFVRVYAVLLGIGAVLLIGMFLLKASL